MTEKEFLRLKIGDIISHPMRNNMNFVIIAKEDGGYVATTKNHRIFVSSHYDWKIVSKVVKRKNYDY